MARRHQTLRPHAFANLFDPDARTYLDNISAFVSPTSEHEEIWDDGIKALKAIGAFTEVFFDLLCTQWNNASANATPVIGNASAATFVGTVSHANRKSTLSSNGYLLTGHAPNAISWTESRMGVMYGLGTAVSSAGAVLDFGSQSAAGVNCVQGALAFSDLGHFTDFGNAEATARVVTALASTTAPVGLYHSNRYSSSQGELVLQNGSGKTLLAISASLIAGTPAGSSAQFILGGRNNNGVVDLHSNRAYTFWATLYSTVSPALADQIRPIIWNIISQMAAT